MFMDVIHQVGVIFTTGLRKRIRRKNSGQGEHVLKQPTVNPTSLGKNKFKENYYNNNEEAFLDYER